MLKKLFSMSNSMFVNIYKLMGFVVLTAILLGIVSYLSFSIFYLFDREWVAPIILSPSSERVIQMNSQLIQQQYNRDKLDVERMLLKAQLSNIERTIIVNKEFQERFKLAVSADLRVREKELKDLQGLYKEYLATRKKVQEASEAFAHMSEEDLKRDLDAGLIEEEAYVRGKMALSQNIMSQISYDQKRIDLEAKSTEIDRKTQALKALSIKLSDPALDNPSATNYDILLMEKEYQTSILEMEELKIQKEPIEKQIALLDESMIEYDNILQTIKQSPYYKAINEKVSIAFVPYTNLPSVKPGVPIYGCSFELLWCRKVGSVVQKLDGEVSARHPMFSSELRGVMIEIKLNDMVWAEEKALHIDSRPFFI